MTKNDIIKALMTDADGLTVKDVLEAVEVVETFIAKAGAVQAAGVDITFVEEK
jgi:nucleoid DNA-binding protein